MPLLLLLLLLVHWLLHWIVLCAFCLLHGLLLRLLLLVATPFLNGCCKGYFSAAIKLQGGIVTARASWLLFHARQHLSPILSLLPVLCVCPLLQVRTGRQPNEGRSRQLSSQVLSMTTGNSVWLSKLNA